MGQHKGGNAAELVQSSAVHSECGRPPQEEQNLLFLSLRPAGQSLPPIGCQPDTDGYRPTGHFPLLVRMEPSRCTPTASDDLQQQPDCDIPLGGLKWQSHRAGLKPGRYAVYRKPDVLYRVWNSEVRWKPIHTSGLPERKGRAACIRNRMGPQPRAGRSDRLYLQNARSNAARKLLRQF